MKNLNKKYLLFTIVLFWNHTFYAQYLECSTDQIHEQILAENEHLRIYHQLTESKYIENLNIPSEKRKLTEITLPVVFHILHEGEEDRLSRSRVLNALSHMNDAFGNRGYYDPNTGLDTKIQFCLAQRDTSGNTFDGILWHQTSLTDMSTHYDHDQLTKLTYYDPEDYINIRVIRNVCAGSDCEKTGYAVNVYQKDLTYRNGIFIQHDVFGVDPTWDVIFLHEAAHFLGLLHTFHGGCKNDNCLEDGDKICDTPPDNSTARKWCGLSENSCYTDTDDGSEQNPYRSIENGGLGDQNDITKNYMDYASIYCYDRFSEGQTQRMHWYIHNHFAHLLNSKACHPPCSDPPMASFIPMRDTVIEIGSSLQFESKSSINHLHRWYYDYDSISTETNVDHSFVELGNHTITLSTSTEEIGCETSSKTMKVEVICPIEARFDYLIEQNNISLTDASVNAETITWQIYDADHTLLFASNVAITAFDFTGYDFLEVCLTAENVYCSVRSCEFITLAPEGLEICNDEVDNDGDGFIDLYDADCPCDTARFQAQCPEECSQLPDEFTTTEMKLKWQSEILGSGFIGNMICGDVDADGDIEVISKKVIGYGWLPQATNYILNIDGSNGETNLEIQHTPENSYSEFSSFLAIADVNHDFIAELFTRKRDSLSCYNIVTGELLWQSYLGSTRAHTNIADFNEDGIPEIYVGHRVLNAQTGALLWVADDAMGCSSGNNTYPIDNSVCNHPHTIAADFTAAPGLELAAGNVVYELNLVNLNGTFGNTATKVVAPAGVTDGLTSAADIDLDGYLDVVINRNINFADGGGVFVWNPRLNKLIASAPSGTDGSVPFIGNLDEDCHPEIGIVLTSELRILEYDGTQNLKIKYSLPTTDGSGFTGLTMFDFNQDGKQEIVYRDETDLRIIDGPTGTTIASTPMQSGTGKEFPIVADVDNDGEAEILVNGYLESNDEYRLYCFESAAAPWAPARSVWNQPGYHVTNINDDLTVPRIQQNRAAFFDTENCLQSTCAQPYNSFMVQATYRSQKGCVVWPDAASDLEITADFRCIGDSIEIHIFTNATDESLFASEIPLSLYSTVDGSLLNQVSIDRDTTIHRIMKPSDTDTLLLVINDAGDNSLPNTDIQECDYLNNEFRLPLISPDLSIQVFDYECHMDSLLLYIAINNTGTSFKSPCISGGCYFADPESSEEGIMPMEITTWCLDTDRLNTEDTYQDTFLMWIPVTEGLTEMWWTVNEGGAGPSYESALVTKIFECNYDNNIDHIFFDISEKQLDLGPDITICPFEALNLNAGAGFESYLWNDYSSDSIYSTDQAGLHFLQATDQCGRLYHDSILVTFDHSNDINLGPDMTFCLSEAAVISVDIQWAELHWYPEEKVDCDTCHTIEVDLDSSVTLVLSGRAGECESLDSITLTRIIPVADTTVVRLCAGDEVQFYDQQITGPDIYSHLSDDCTTMEVWNVQYEHHDTTLIEKQICRNDSFYFNGTYLSNTGMYSDIQQNLQGCDSLIQLNLMVRDSIHSTETIEACFGEPITVQGEWFDSDTVIHVNALTNAGCDSIHSVSIKFNELPSNSYAFDICHGDSIYLYGAWYNTEGVYTYQQENLIGCDSIIEIAINHRPEVISYDTLTFCQGDTLDLLGFSVFKTMDVSQSFNSFNGCDSTIFIHAKQLESLSTEEEISLCPSDSLWFNDQWIVQTGTYHQTLVSTGGCDSTHTLIIERLHSPSSPDIWLDCDNEQIIAEFSNLNLEPWQIVWSNGDTSPQTAFTDESYATVSLTTPFNCVETYTIDLPHAPSIMDLPILNDTSIIEDGTLAMNLELDKMDWSVLWSIDGEIDCDTCLMTTIYPLMDTDVELTFTHSSGCSFEKSFHIKLLTKEKNSEKIILPNVFTPNGDGQNDLWTYSLPLELQFISVQIFDRWGNIVFQSTDEAKGWNGESKYQKVQEGVYLYLIKYEDTRGELHSIAGDLTLIY